MSMQLGDRIKSYEIAYTSCLIKQNDPLIVRLDGKNFSNYTRNLVKDIKPFSTSFSNIMIETATHLLNTFNAKVVFTVSDEITLVFVNSKPTSQHPFRGKLFKIQSIMASVASTFFVSRIPTTFPEKIGRLPVFDCRAFATPSLIEAYNSVFWRHRDGYKNYVDTAARYHYSAQILYGVNTSEKIKMLLDKGFDFEQIYPNNFKNGVCLVRIKKTMELTPEQIELLPEKHNARLNGSNYERTEVVEINMERLKELLCNDSNIDVMA